jgi:hypothetical protein
MTRHRAATLLVVILSAASALPVEACLRPLEFGAAHFLRAAQAAGAAAASTPETKIPSPLSKYKDGADIAKDLAEIIGLGVGGLWTWRLFIKNRQDYPRAKITHTISHANLPGGKRWLRVTANVTNIGPVFLGLAEGFVWVQQILPPPSEFTEKLHGGEDPVTRNETEYKWPLIAERKFDWKESPREVEPNEEDHIQFDFVIDAEAALIEIYSYFENERKTSRKIGWEETSLYEFKQGTLLSGIVVAQGGPKEKPPWKFGLGII